jgi:hypothetical protein
MLRSPTAAVLRVSPGTPQYDESCRIRPINRRLWMGNYKTLRTWAMFLMAIGVISVVMAGLGVLSLAIAVDGFWDTVGVLFLGTPIAMLLASWPFALGQALRALADIGDSVVVASTVDTY